MPSMEPLLRNISCTLAKCRVHWPFTRPGRAEHNPVDRMPATKLECVVCRWIQLDAFTHAPTTVNRNNGAESKFLHDASAILDLWRQIHAHVRYNNTRFELCTHSTLKFA